MRNFSFPSRPSTLRWLTGLTALLWGLISHEATAQITITAGTISTNTTWSTPQRVRGTVRIAPGITLTITTRVEFDDTKNLTVAVTSSNATRIIVEPGGILVLNGATLAPLADPTLPAALMWDGIVVQGSSTAKGFVRASNNSVIEGARIGFLMGTPTYSSARQLLVTASNADGGGRVYLTQTTLLNCHTGAYITEYNPAGATNANQFDNCIFRADAPLADPYYTTSGTRLPTQYGVRSFHTGTPSVASCTFELIDNTAAFGYQLVPATLRGYGCYASNSGFFAMSSTFKNLYIGVSINNIELAYGSTISDNTFEGNIGGVLLGGVVASNVYRNTFLIGRSTDLFQYGLALYNSSGYTVRDNTFESGPDCPTGGCTYARGLTVTLSDGPVVAAPISNKLYRNSFSNLSTGMFVQRGNAGLLLQCNSFRGPSRTTTGTLSRADIEVLVGTSVTTSDQSDMLLNNRDMTTTPPTLIGHGRCIATDQSKAANNIFSHTGGSARDMLVSYSPYMPALLYDFTPTGIASTTSAITQPRSVTTPSSSLAGITPNGCVSTASYDYSLACPDPVDVGGGGLSPEQLKVMIDTTTDAYERGLLLNQLLSYYLNDTTLTHGVDSAIVALEGYGTSSYNDIYAGLRERGGYPPGEGLRATHQESGTARRDAAIRTHYDDVRELLAPYGEDREALATALQTDTDLRTQLEEIAADTTVWGYISAQAVLSQYLDYHYKPWYEQPATEDLNRSSGVLGTSSKRMDVARLFPNPTSNAVTISYALPTGFGHTEVVVVDALGKVCGRVALKGTLGETELSLSSLSPGLYVYRVLVQGSLVQTGKVVKVP
jgi:Periplasmic copper-binding protein (NosD)/Secretion system C-terminal sorting domain